MRMAAVTSWQSHVPAARPTDARARQRQASGSPDSPAARRGARVRCGDAGAISERQRHDESAPHRSHGPTDEALRFSIGPRLAEKRVRRGDDLLSRRASVLSRPREVEGCGACRDGTAADGRPDHACGRRATSARAHPADGRPEARGTAGTTTMDGVAPPSAEKGGRRAEAVVRELTATTSIGPRGSSSSQRARTLTPRTQGSPRRRVLRTKRSSELSSSPATSAAGESAQPAIRTRRR